MVGSLAFLLLQQGYDTRITIDEKDVLLPAVLNEIGERSGIKVDLPREFWNLKVTVFVKDMMARALLDKLASLYDFEGTADPSKYLYRLPPVYRRNFERYLVAEFQERMKPAKERLEALAKLTTRPFGDPRLSIPPQGGTEAQTWAAKKIGEPAYYTAGVFLRAWTLRPGYRPTWYFNLTLPEALVFTVDEPLPSTATSIRESLGMRWPTIYVDENSRAIASTTIALSAYGTTGDLRVVTVRGVPASQDSALDRPFMYARPPRQLQGFPFAKELAAWETPIDTKDWSPRSQGAGNPPDPGYFNGKFSLSEKLENLHNRVHVPIIATSFRSPALKQQYAAASDPSGLIDDLVKNEKAFVRWDNGCLLVRHPAYWIFECSEPSEAILQEAERIAKDRVLGLFEYAGLAYFMSGMQDDVAPWNRSPLISVAEVLSSHHSAREALTGEGFHEARGLPHAFERLVGDRGLLLRFDPEPLARAYPALAALGACPPPFLQRIADGEHLRLEDVSLLGWTPGGIEWAGFQSIKIGKRIRTGTTEYPIRLEPGHPIIRDAFDGRLCFAADIAPIFPTSWTDHFITEFELEGRDHTHIFDSRAEQVWIDVQGEDDYRICLGFNDEAVVTYSFKVHPKPGAEGS